jgi:hypothetical protein
MTKADNSPNLGSRPDLTRPAPSSPLKRYPPPSALIVGRGREDTADLRAALVEDGWQINSCRGPTGQTCPLLTGRGPCTERECADVAVVFLDAAHSVAGSLPLVRCAADPSSPAVVALEGQADAPVLNGDRALVGGLRSARTMVDAVDEVTGLRS